MTHNQQTSSNGAQESKTVQVAIYTRKSNDENLNGSVTSIDNQKAACRSYIQIYKDKGWQEYTETFDDPAESGKDLKRPAMQRLLKAVQEGRVQGVIVYKIDRLTRNSRDFHYLMELFEKHNVAFVSATESIDTKSPQGRLMINIMVQFAQYDRELDQERSKDFHLARARKGLWCAGLPPLGYDAIDKLLVINEEEANLVRKIFDLYLKEQSTISVAEELNRLGFKRKSYQTLDGRPFGGKPFDMDSVTRILRRKIYIGFVTNERTGQEFQGQHKPIITPQVFEAAQKLLDTHNKREGLISHNKNKYGFLLKGLIRCGECDSAVVPFPRPKGKKVYLYYKCLAQQNGLPIKCGFKTVGSQKVEEFVIEKLAATGWDQPFLERVIKKIDEKTKAGVKQLERERRDAEERLKSTQREIQNLVDIAKVEGASGRVARELERLGTSSRELEALLMDMEAKIAFRKRAVYDVDVVAGALQRFARFIYRIPVELRIQTIRLMVKQVTVWKDRIHVQLHELPVRDLQRSLEGKIALNIPDRDKSRRSIRREQNPTTETSQLNGNCGTAVVEVKANWRGRRDLNPRSPA